MILPKDLLHELQQGGDINEDVKEFFRLKEKRAEYDVGMGSVPFSIMASSFVYPSSMVPSGFVH